MADDIAQISIIQTKLNRPAAVENYVDRPHQIAKLDQRLQLPLTLVTAPAGYGKSVLVSAWLEASSYPRAWVSLDKGDNDLRVFLSYFLTAIQSSIGTGFSDAFRETLAILNALELPPMSVLTGTLINEIDRIETPFIIALDDFHLIEDKSVLDLINQLLLHPPKPMHIVLISRRDPFLPISSMRASITPKAWKSATALTNASYRQKGATPGGLSPGVASVSSSACLQRYSS